MFNKIISKIKSWLDIEYKPQEILHMKPIDKFKHFNKLNVDLLHYKYVKIEPLFSDITKYYNALNILLEHDYNKPIRYSELKFDKKEIYIKDWIIEKNMLVDDYNLIFVDIIKLTMELYFKHKELEKNKHVNSFNSTYIKQYIINVQNIVDSILLHYKY